MGEEDLLAACYRSTLALAKEKKLDSIAFPVISSGTFEFPKGMVLKIANSAILDFLLANDMKVYLLVYDEETFSISEKLFSSVKQYIDDNYIDERETEKYSVSKTNSEI